MAAVLGDIPALPLHEAGKYVAGAYVVLVALILIYVSIMAIRLSRLERRLRDLLREEPLENEERLSPPEPEAPRRESMPA